MQILRKFVLVSLLVFAVIAFVLWQQFQQFMTVPLKVAEQGLVYNVKQGSNLLSISTDLKRIGLTESNPHWLYFYGRFHNKAHLIKAGEYLIQANTTLPQLLDQFVGGKVVQKPFTIVEGMTAQQLIDMIANDPRIVQTLTKHDLASVMSQLGLSDNHGEGEFAPETYYFSSGTTDVQMLARAHQMMSKLLDEAWQNKADDLPYKSPYEALIMASIIEKETGIAEERPQIAGVFVRRLKKGMRLQTDPTVIYGLGDEFNGNLQRKHLITDTPYNTYTRSGLPPTPIALPSKESIEAALHPASGNSLYFVAMGKEGRHVFSDTLSEHNQAVRRYQLKK